MLTTKRKLVNKILKEKCAATKDLEKGVSNKGVAEKYSVPKNTISTWVKRKDKLFSALEKGSNIKRQKLRKANHDCVDQALLKWFLGVRSQNVPVSGTLIKEKAVQYAEALGIVDFTGSDGWLWRRKERNSIVYKTVFGESNSVSSEMVNPWNETSLPTILPNYELKDIYNADDCGLYNLCLSDKMYHLKSEKCSGGKNSKTRITGMAAAVVVVFFFTLF